MMRPMPEDFAEKRLHMTVEELAEHYKAGRNTVRRWRTELGDPKISYKKSRPDSFARLVLTMTDKELAEHYNVDPRTVANWRRDLGLPARKPAERPIPHNFLRVYELRGSKGAAKHFSAGRDTVARWLRECGIKPAIGRRVKSTLKPMHFDFRDGTILSRAQSHLQKFGPVFRCDQRGGFSHNGAFYNVFGAVLEPDEMLARAKRKGFDADEWRRAA